MSDSRNKELLNKYRNAILYSLQFEKNALQAMSFDGYQNTGIKYPDRGIETSAMLWKPDRIYPSMKVQTERQRRAIGHIGSKTDIRLSSAMSTSALCVRKR